jgi:hypothetical protein
MSSIPRLRASVPHALHRPTDSCWHTVATAMDSLGILQQIRRQRLGHSGNSVTDNYTHFH